jgi:predicted hydrolase (HD superfamily)
VKRKLKDKAFARSVNRDDIRLGVEELGVPLEVHIRFVIDALRPVQKEIGLNSTAT